MGRARAMPQRERSPLGYSCNLLILNAYFGDMQVGSRLHDWQREARVQARVPPASCPVRGQRALVHQRLRAGAPVCLGWGSPRGLRVRLRHAAARHPWRARTPPQADRRLGDLCVIASMPSSRRKPGPMWMLLSTQAPRGPPRVWCAGGSRQAAMGEHRLLVRHCRAAWANARRAAPGRESRAAVSLTKREEPPPAHRTRDDHTFRDQPGSGPTKLPATRTGADQASAIENTCPRLCRLTPGWGSRPGFLLLCAGSRTCGVLAPGAGTG